jgi:hypothetical protein
MNWIKELLFGKEEPYRENEYEAGKTLGIGCWIFIIIAAYIFIRFVVWTLSINW